MLCAFLLAGIGVPPVPAQVGMINLASVPNSGACAGRDTPGLKTIYVQHSIFNGATGSRFRIENGPGATLTYVSEVHHFPQTIGDSQSGITICYEGCIINTQVLVSITYMFYGTSEPCSELRIVPHPDSETVEAMDCNYEPVADYVQDFKFLGDCGCGFMHDFPGTPRSFGCAPLPAEPSTWGRVKALYR